MENWLVNHAYTNIWCQPANDRRWIVKPERLTPDTGSVFGLQVQGYSIRLPIEKTWFHVFQLGAMSHRELGITELTDTWVRLDRIVSYYGTMITLYGLNGRTYPLGKSWIRKQSNGNVLVATEMLESMIDLTENDLYIRFYNGAYRYTSDYVSDQLSEVVSGDVTSSAIRFSLINKFDEFRDRSGEPTAYVNGYEVDDLTTQTLALWDYVEIVYDGIVEFIEYFPVKDLLSFTSTLDGKRKYLLHLPKQMDTIHFINDIDISILKGDIGYYFHQHKSESFRQVTHNDYSILVNRFNEYILNDDDWNDSDELTIKMTVRRSGMDRPLTLTNNRIHELYKLSDEGIVNAIAGSVSNVAEWRGAHLENDMYNRIMAAQYTTITNEMCTEAYGYNAVAKYTADTPNKTSLIGGENKAILAPLLARNCTVYEYDKDGLLLGYYNYFNNVDQTYPCKESKTTMVEAIEGQGGSALSLHIGHEGLQVEPGVNYRYYLNHLVSGVESDVFEDVTDTDMYTVGDDGLVVWTIDTSRRKPYVVSDFTFLTYGREEVISDGLIKFTIDHLINGVMVPCYFEPETLELWLNGYLLVPDIDYFVEWPQVVVCNKSYLETGTNPWIDVRCRGLAEHVRKPKTGFVVDGMLSNNVAFDLRDDKVVQISVGGMLKHRDDVTFREDSAVDLKGTVNGQPYMVNDPTIPLRDLVTVDTYMLRDESRDLDDRIGKYLSTYIPTPTGIEHNPIPSLHALFSPLMNKVIRDMLVGDLVPVADDELFYISTRQFDALMLEYQYLLNYEPTLQDVDMRYVTVHPHHETRFIYLTPIQMALIERINDRYLDNKVIVNKLLGVKA